MSEKRPKNPFTPAYIVSLPDEFFGRSKELRTLEKAVAQGSLAISGAMGIGKSSLLARTRLLLEGFDSTNKSQSVLAAGNREVETLDEAARLLLGAFTSIDERSSKFRIGLAKVIEFEASDIQRRFAPGRHLAALVDLLRKIYADKILPGDDYLVIAIDEADKCPVPLARLIRVIATEVEHEAMSRVRFLLAGVSPYFQVMVNEDAGISRFFYKRLTLNPMNADEAYELLMTKFERYAKQAAAVGPRVHINPTTVNRIINLSGGHPHVLQLLGSHLIDHEEEDPDGVLDSKDLVDSLRTICYDVRADIYKSTIHALEIYGMLDAVRSLISLAGTSIPTVVNRDKAESEIDSGALQWLVNNDVIRTVDSSSYGLVDEFLRVRMVFDDEGKSDEIERQLIRQSGGATRYREELIFDEDIMTEFDSDTDSDE